MREEVTVKYISDDGKRFDDRDACRRHEATIKLIDLITQEFPSLPEGKRKETAQFIYDYRQQIRVMVE